MSEKCVESVENEYGQLVCRILPAWNFNSKPIHCNGDKSKPACLGLYDEIEEANDEQNKK